MKLKSLVFGAVAGLFCACEDGLQLPDFQLGDTSNLSINVITEQAESKGLITDTYLPSGSAIGVTVLNTSGGNYDGTAYSNIKFTSLGTGTGQTWAGATTVKLSATEGYCYAYYPYNSYASSITAIPVTAGSTDYLYATKQSVNDKSYSVTLPMKHALAAIRFALKRGTYAGTGKVTGVSDSSAALGSSGTLDATTGAVTASNKGAAVSQSASLTLSTTAQNVDVVMVPSGTAGSITLSVTIDGKAYSTTVSSTTIAQGNCYTYTLTVNAGALALSGVKVGDWGYNDNGAPTITAAGYTVTFAGDYSDLLFTNTVSEDGTVNIKSRTLVVGGLPKSVTTLGTATLSQSVSGGLRTIMLSGIASNVTVTFYGYIAPPTAIADNWYDLADGVYVVRPDLKPANASEGNETCIGVGLVNNAKSQRLMIEKFEDNNNPESTTIYTNAAQSSYTSGHVFTWGGYGSDQDGITNNSKVVGTKSSGFLYLSGSGLDIEPSNWSSGALSDFAGRSNSIIIKSITNNGSIVSSAYPMALLLNAFNDTDCPISVNQNFRDWSIPSCGQLGLIWLNKTALDNALTVIGGTAIQADKYWSSSEYHEYGAWFVNLSNGWVNGNDKSSVYRVRLVRSL